MPSVGLDPGDSDLLLSLLLPRPGIGWSSLAVESGGAAFGSCLQSLESSAGLQDLTLRGLCAPDRGALPRRRNPKN